MAAATTILSKVCWVGGFPGLSQPGTSHLESQQPAVARCKHTVCHYESCTVLLWQWGICSYSSLPSLTCCSRPLVILRSKGGVGRATPPMPASHTAPYVFLQGILQAATTPWQHCVRPVLPQSMPCLQQCFQPQDYLTSQPCNTPCGC